MENLVHLSIRIYISVKKHFIQITNDLNITAIRQSLIDKINSKRGSKKSAFHLRLRFI